MHLREPTSKLGGLATTQEGLTLKLGVLVARLGAPQFTVEQTGKNNIFFGNAAGAPRNYSYYLSFNDF
jgi:hypothetical protein